MSIIPALLAMNTANRIAMNNMLMHSHRMSSSMYNSQRREEEKRRYTVSRETFYQNSKDGRQYKKIKY